MFTLRQCCAGSPSEAFRRKVKACAGPGLYGSRREAGNILLNTLSSSMQESDMAAGDRLSPSVSFLSYRQLAAGDRLSPSVTFLSCRQLVCAVSDQVKALSLEMISSADSQQLRMMMDMGMKQSRGGGAGQSASPWARLGPQRKSPSGRSQPSSALSPSPASAEPAKPSWQWDDVSICVLGLGSIGKYRSQLASGRPATECTRASARLHQLALAVSLPSIFDAFDVALIHALGGSVTSVDSAGAVTQDAIACLSPTLLYMPCCTRALNAQVADANLRAGSLDRVIILGNSWRTFVESEGLLRALSGGAGRGGVMPPSIAGSGGTQEQEEDPDTHNPEKWVLLTELTQAGVVSELPAPDFAAHGVAMGLHLFKSDALITFKTSKG
eukprot:gene24960-10618_t